MRLALSMIFHPKRCYKNMILIKKEIYKKLYIQVETYKFRNLQLVYLKFTGRPYTIGADPFKYCILQAALDFVK